MEDSEKEISVTVQQGSTAHQPAPASQRQRASIRKTVSCTVQLRHAATLILPCTVADLNLTGIFVEMDTQGVAVGDRIEVWIGAGSTQQNPFDLILQSDVVRIEDRGLALKFLSYPSKAYTELVNLLYAW